MSLAVLEEWDVLSCMQCGRCTGGCPVSIRTVLNIRKLIYQNLQERKKWLQTKDVWCCTTCSTCAVRCPKGVSIVDYIVALRSYQVERGKIEPAARDALESILKHGNPWGRVREKRTEWIEENNVRILSEGDSVDILLYVGCTPAYEPKAQITARALVKLLNEAGVDYGILGTVETCCGNEVKRMGEEGLFEMLVEENIETFGKYSFNRIVTISPHCFNTFKNEYEDLKVEVIHYTELLREFVESGKLGMESEITANVIFHDPCFLGKQNDIYEDPRIVLSRFLSNELIEFERCRERSMCCEGGGGRMWIEVESDLQRTAEERVKDAEYCKADIIATSCPFCLLTLSDAIKTAGFENKIKVMDICSVIVGEEEQNAED